MDTLILAALLLSASIGNISGIKGTGTLDAEPGEFPYLVNIVDYWNKDLIGSGVLIKSRVVLASGSALVDKYPFDIVVILGEYDRSNDAEESKQEIDVSKIVLHPELEQNSAADLALLQLEREPKMGKMVQKFGLENIISSHRENNHIYNKSGECVVPGFGLTKWNEFERTWPETLKKYIPDMRETLSCTHPYIRKLLICTRDEDHTKICKYDGGTPLLCNKDGQMKLYGITMESMGYFKYCDQGESWFTRVSTYYNWIKRNTRNLQREKFGEQLTLK